MKKIIISALLMASLAGGAYAASSADVILGFRAAGGTGATTNLEIDLGSISTFKSVVGTHVITNISSLGSNGTNSIDTVYGSGWASRTDLFWGATGTVSSAPGPDGEVAKTIWGTVQAPTSAFDGNSTTTAWNDIGTTGESSASTTISALYLNFGSFGTQIGQSYTTGNTNPGAWTHQESTTAVAFKAFPTATLFENTNAGVAVASDLYQIVGNNAQPAGTFLGTLAVLTNGNVEFITAIPEPSVYAAILGAATLGFVAIRRRKQQILA